MLQALSLISESTRCRWLSPGASAHPEVERGVSLIQGRTCNLMPASLSPLPPPQSPLFCCLEPPTGPGWHYLEPREQAEETPQSLPGPLPPAFPCLAGREVVPGRVGVGGVRLLWCVLVCTQLASVCLTAHPSLPAMQQVLDNLGSLPNATGAAELDLIFLRGIMESPIVRSLAKV